MLFQAAGRAMGSLDRGTTCAYCGARRAGYIPDGASGPMCGRCMDWMWAGGRPDLLRLSRRARRFLVLCPAPAHPAGHPPDAATVLLDEHLALIIARCLIWL